MRLRVRWLLVVAALSLVALCWYVLGPGSAPASVDPAVTVGSGVEPSAAAVVAAPDVAAPSPATADAGPEDAPSRGEAGAAAAALRFLELTEDVARMAPAEAAAVQRSISTEASADRLAGEVGATLTDVALSVPAGVTVEIAPLGSYARPAGDGWEVSVWYVEVVVYGDELAVEQWRTATYSLEWEAGEWRMADLVSSDGPTPVRPASAVASTTAELVTATGRFSDDGWGS